MSDGSFTSCQAIRIQISDSDYHGALAAGMRALLLSRRGPDGERAHRAHKALSTNDEAPADVVEDLESVIRWVKDYNRA